MNAFTHTIRAMTHKVDGLHGQVVIMEIDGAKMVTDLESFFFYVVITARMHTKDD